MIAVLDYGIGNLRSAQKALERFAPNVQLVTTPEAAAGASGVVLPGVGAFGRCMDALESSGLRPVAEDAITTGVPFLGVCVGMQLLYEGSEEDPGVAGLGVLPGTVGRLPVGEKHPQIQWNPLRFEGTGSESAMFEGIADGAWVYFVHSYAPPESSDVIATCDYGGRVVAAVERGSVWATQFHPEKSSSVGLRILANFVGVCDRAAGGVG